MVDNPERRLILAYASGAAARDALAALLALDDRLADTVRTTSEPMLGQIRLKWWHDAILALDGASPPAEPLLELVARDVVAAGVRGADLAGMADAWAELLGSELDAEALQRHAQRGACLFVAAGRVARTEPSDPLALAGQGWALADLAAGLSDAGEVAAARLAAGTALDQALSVRWSRKGRALGAMAQFARLDLAGIPVGSPRRVARALWRRLSGR